MTIPNPTDGEVAVVRILWRRQAPATVREVHDDISRTKNTASTTVLKMLTIRAENGLVRRDETERSHTYRPVQEEEVVQSSLLDDLLQRAFSGSAFTLVQRALDNSSTSAEELDAVAKLIAKARRESGWTVSWTRHSASQLRSQPRWFIQCGSARCWGSSLLRRSEC